MNETKKPLNFCVCVIEADNKGKKKSALYVQAMHKTKTSK